MPSVPSRKVAIRPGLPALALGLFCLALPGGARAAAGALQPGEDIAAALARSAPGAVITLAPGDHGALSLKGAFGSPEAPVTLRSADPADPARLGALSLKDAGNLVFQDLVFDYEFEPGQNPGKHRPFSVTGSRLIHFANVLFDGDRAEGTESSIEGFGAGFGLWIADSRGIEIRNATFHTFYRGIVVSGSDEVLLKDSDFHSLRSDGADFAAVRRVVIEGNHFHDFEHDDISGAHPDMIQFWTAGTDRPSQDIVIRDNILNAGLGSWTQSLFMRNEMVDSGKAGREMFYRDITISGNVIINAHLHGITVGETDGLQITANSLIRSSTARGMEQQKKGISTPTIRVKPASDGVQITRNLVRTITGAEERPDWQISDNLLIDPDARGGQTSYDSVFLAARQARSGDLGPYGYRPEGPAATAGLGSGLLRLDRIDGALQAKGAAPPLLAAMAARAADPAAGTAPPTAETGAATGANIHVEADPKAANRYRLAVASSQGIGKLSGTWRLADGQELTAPGIEVTFPAPGPQPVTLVTETGESRIELDLPDPLVLDLARDAAALGLRLQPAKGAEAALYLEPGAASTETPSSAVSALFGARNLRLSLRFRSDRDAASPAGEILRIHGHLGLTLTATGAMAVLLTTESGAKPMSLQSPPLRLHDGQWHELILQHDADSQNTRLEIDGKLVAERRGGGAMAPAPGRARGLDLRSPHAKSLFTGWLADLRIEAASQAWSPVTQITITRFPP